MSKIRFSGELKTLMEKAVSGKSGDIDYILEKLNGEVSFATTRYVDFALGLVRQPDGIERIRYYLFSGTLIQRNYCSLYFNRRGDWKPVKEAFDLGLIDEIQAFAR